MKEDNSTDFKPICPEGYILLETNFIMKAGLTGFYHVAHQKLKQLAMHATSNFLHAPYNTLPPVTGLASNSNNKE